MNLVSKFFWELTTEELYEILKVRTKIFIVEQNYPYLDPDGMDYQSLHVFYEENGQVLAYLRAFRKDEEMVQMGRVLSAEHGKGYGGKILTEGLDQIRQKMNPKRIYIEAQCYATRFYEREGFRICSEEFLEDGIPHVIMIKEM